MTLIQPVLIVALICAAIFYRAKMRSRLADRLIVFSIAAAGIVLVASPNLSTAIARTLGVGRGADLVMYLGLVGTGFVLLLLFSRIRALESQITALVRELAVLRGEAPDARRPTL